MGCRFHSKAICIARQGCQDGLQLCGAANFSRARPVRAPVRTRAADTPVLPALDAVPSTHSHVIQPIVNNAAAPTHSHAIQPMVNDALAPTHSHVMQPNINGAASHPEHLQAVVDMSQQLVSNVLSTNLNICNSEAAKIFRRNAAAALCSEYDIQARVAELQGLLGIPEQECIGVICKEPQLLTLGWNDIQQHLTGLSAVCLCGLERAKSMALAKPFLLTLSADRLQQKLSFLKGALHLDEPQLLPWVVSHPSVLCHSMHSVTDKLTWLQSFFGAEPSAISELIIKNPAVLQLSSARLCTEVTAMSKAVKVGCLLRMLRQEPRILTVTNARLQQRIADLQEMLQVSKPETVRLLKQRPSLICKSLKSLQKALKVLKRLPMSESALSQLVAAHPLLLRLSPRVLHRRCNSIRHVIRKSKVYRYTFSKLPPHLWGVVIMHWDCAASKICYLAESAQEVKMSLLDALRATDDQQFLRSFPEYQQWRQWKKAGVQDAHNAVEPSTATTGPGSHRPQSRLRRPSARRNVNGTTPWAHATRKAGVDEVQMGDFSHYADLPATEHLGRYLLHRPHKPKQHLHTPNRSRSTRSSSPSSSHSPRSTPYTPHSSSKPLGPKHRNSTRGRENKVRETKGLPGQESLPPADTKKLQNDEASSNPQLTAQVKEVLTSEAGAINQSSGELDSHSIIKVTSAADTSTGCVGEPVEGSPQRAAAEGQDLQQGTRSAALSLTGVMLGSGAGDKMNTATAAASAAGCLIESSEPGTPAVNKSNGSHMGDRGVAHAGHDSTLVSSIASEQLEIHSASSEGCRMQEVLLRRAQEQLMCTSP